MNLAVQELNKASSGPRFIVVEGPIGVGKTSLARRLAESFSAELVLEGPEQNPFLEQFYKSRRKVALPAQLFFLFQRARQLEAAAIRHVRTGSHRGLSYRKGQALCAIELEP